MSPLGPISEVAAPLIEDRSVGHSGLDLAHVEFFAFLTESDPRGISREFEPGLRVVNCLS